MSLYKHKINKREEEFLNNIKHDTLKLITKVEKLEQQIINLNAKHKFEINEIMLIIEKLVRISVYKKNNDSLWKTLKKVETRINDRVHALESAAILEQEQANQEVAVVTKWENDKKKTKNMTSCIGYRGED